MGKIIVIVILIALVWNGISTAGRQKKRMKDWNCCGDCDSCDMPCRAKCILGKDTPKDAGDGE